MNAGLFFDSPYTKKMENAGTLIVFQSMFYIIIEKRLKKMY